jgi:hypothetical protein
MFHVAAGRRHTNKISDAIVQSVMKLASITFLSLVFFPTGLIYLGLITERRLAAGLIIPSLGVPNWPVIYIINTAPSETSAREAGWEEMRSRVPTGIHLHLNTPPLKRHSTAGILGWDWATLGLF